MILKETDTYTTTVVNQAQSRNSSYIGIKRDNMQ